MTLQGVENDVLNKTSTRSNRNRQILPGTASDIPQIAGLYDTLNDYLASSTNYPGWIKGIYPTRQNAEAGLQENNLFVAKENDIIVGSIILNHHPEAAYDKAKWLLDCDYSQIIVIHTLAVHPHYLSQGIGKSLLDFALRYAKDTGMCSIRLDVYQQNLPAIRLYEKCGYTYIATVDLGLAEYGLDRFRLYELLV